jgi:hypothetical protein
MHFGRLNYVLVALLAALLAARSAAMATENQVTTRGKRLTRKDVVDYLNQYSADRVEDLTPDSICSFAVTKLGNPLQSALLVSLDVNGRHFCNAIDAITGPRNHLRLAEVRVWEEDEVAKLVQVPEGASRPYLIVSSPISDYEGASGCIATVPRIYDVKSGHLMEASQLFPSFYRKRIETEMAPAAPHLDSAFCKVMEIDKMKRMSGIQTNAGYETALSWMHAPDRRTREKAVSTFADIRDVPSLAALQRMSHDQDELVSHFANGALKHIVAHGPDENEPSFSAADRNSNR